MRNFALPVVRVLVPLNPWSIVPYLAKQRERQARQALSLRPEQQLYCRFGRRRGSLECAFSAGSRESAGMGLLGETIRDWLETETAGDFLWCEAGPEGLAMALVIGGHVAKDGVFRDAHAGQELKLAMSQLMRCETPTRVYYGDPTSEGHLQRALPELGTDVELLSAPDTLDGYLAGGGSSPTLTTLETVASIRAWNRLWRLVRYAATATVLAAIAGFGWWAVEQLQRDEQPIQQTPDRVKRNYAKLLRTPPAGDVLLVIHAAYRDFVGDRIFAGYADVAQADWTGTRVGTPSARDTSSPLRIEADLRVTDDDWRYRGQAREFIVRLADYAAGEGWTDLVWHAATAADRGQRIVAKPAGFSVVRALEPAVDRDVQEALANQRPPPRSEDGALSRTNALEENLADVGAAQVVGVRDWEVYETAEMQLRLDDAEWLDRDVIVWVANWLNKGPIVLDSVEVTTAARRAENATVIRFRLVWCIAEGLACVEPLTEADFIPLAGGPTGI